MHHSALEEHPGNPITCRIRIILEALLFLTVETGTTLFTWFYRNNVAHCHERRAQMKIGILDDNPAILDVLATMLELEGHTVSTHATGLSLLEALFPDADRDAPIPYNLLILDLLLPGDMSGANFYMLIRKSIPAEELPIIFITAAGEKDIQNLKMAFPDVPLLRKPIRRQDLLQAINAYFLMVGL